MRDFDQAWASGIRAGRPREPGAPAEPLTPPLAEDRIERLSDALEDNEQALIEAADAELDAQGALDDAEIKWRLHEDCPQAGVVDGRRTTVAYVDAWVAGKTAPERRELKVAKQRRQAAEKQLRRIERQLIAAQSIAKSVAGRAG